MGYISLAVLALTGVALLFGALFGLMRGLNRSLLRLGLVLVCAILAIALRGVFVDIILNIETDKGTLQEMLMSSFVTEEMTMPQSMIDLIFALIEIVIGLAVYYVLFIVLRLLTWMIFFPILKIFVKKGEKKRPWWGALVGLGQGLVIAFLMWAPVSGLLAQADKLMALEVDGKKISEEIPEEIGLTDYAKSAPGSVYNAVGGWYFEILGSAETEDGKTVRLSDTCDIVVVVLDIVDEVQDLTESVERIDPDNASVAEMADAVRDVGDILVSIDTAIDSLSADAKAIINDLISSVGEMAGEEGVTLPDDFTLDSVDLGAAGHALVGLADYFEKVENDQPETVTQEEVNAIVNGFAANMAIFDLMAEGEELGELMPVDDAAHQVMFNLAIAQSGASAEDQNTLKTVFGLN